MTPEDFEAAVRGLLAEVPAMTLATFADGVPWATDVYFAPDGYDLVFFSSPKSRHCRNLEISPACAATVHPAVASWREIRGLQMEGRAFLVEGAAGVARALRVYAGKFPFVRDILENPVDAARTFAKSSAHVFRPSRVRYLDNALGLGARFSRSFTDGKPDGPPRREDPDEA